MTLLVDANSVYARSYFAALSSEPRSLDQAWRRYYLNCLFGVLKAVGKHEKILFCWDGSTAKTVKPRDDKPESYYVYSEAARKTTELIFGATSCVQMDIYESDDLVATVAFRELESDRRNADVVVVSADKDLTQLAGPGIRYYCLNKKRFVPADEIAKRWGVRRPSQVSIALAIIGDKGDGVDGVKGMGRKAVEKLFTHVVTEEMTLSEAYEAVENEMVGERLRQFQESFSKTLLNTGIPDVPWPVKYDPVDPDSLDVTWREDYAQALMMENTEMFERHVSRLEDSIANFKFDE
jgi:5'-3' exonuclease